jgi:hypothetical protein
VQTAKSAAAQVGSEVTKVLPLVSAATAAADALMPADAVLITGVSSTVEAALTELAALCNTYATNPSDTVWQSIVASVNTLVTQGATGLLNAAKITDPASRATALTVLGAVQTGLLIIDGLIQTTQTTTQNATAAQARLVKLREIEPYLNHQMVEEATGHSFKVVYNYETSLGY